MGVKDWIQRFRENVEKEKVEAQLKMMGNLEEIKERKRRKND